MSNYIYAVVLLLLALGVVVIRKTYFSVPVLELKRKAEQNDQFARTLYKAVAYGNSLRGLLWLFIGLTTAGALILLVRELPVWVSLLVVGPLLWIAFSLLPSSRVTKIGARLTMTVTPAIAWLLNYLHPVLGRGADVVESRYVAAKHTGLYERADLVELIEQQQNQMDNRITEEELEIARRALSFEDYKVGDILTSRKKIKTVLATDTVGPILIDELHKSQQDSVLVRDKAKGMIVGTLEFKKLGIGSQGQVKDLMNPKVYYVHENDSLSEALHAFFVTNHPAFIVVNNFEEYVGIITVESMLKQLMGHVPGDDFDQYSDVAAVAARHNKPKKSVKPEETPVKTDEEVVE